MNETMVISIPALVMFAVILVFPVLIFRHLRLRLTRDLLISMARMAVQLTLVAVYLEYIFKLDMAIVNAAWVLVMIVVASGSILRQSLLSWRKCIWTILPAHLLTSLLILTGFLLVFDSQTITSARYLVPLMGMVLGNILRSNVVALDRFFSELRAGVSVHIQYLTLGANSEEAVRPFLRNALRAAVGPQIGTVATMGIVSLPGMMTGQILGGSSPAVAIGYQIMIMIAIFTAATVSSFLAVHFATRAAFDSYGRLDESIFLHKP
ncbi:MAG: ABC transporter permease [Desulfomicrobium sp.]